jgi:hypothetical protein
MVKLGLSHKARMQIENRLLRVIFTWKKYEVRRGHDNKLRALRWAGHVENMRVWALGSGSWCVLQECCLIRCEDVLKFNLVCKDIL